MIQALKLSQRNILIGGLIVFVITSIFSTGSYHQDEHFQILEFCHYKLGNSPASDLPWEFHERIRPTLQPAIAVLLIKSMHTIGIHDPFSYALILRILTGLFSWWVLSNLCLLLVNDLSVIKKKKVLMILTFFLWFMPLISVRFSSENYSAITFLAAIYYILRFNQLANPNRSYQLIIAGLLLGFSFFFRFQIGFAILGLALWMILINKTKWKYLIWITISAVVSMGICIYIDFWFYGEYEITPVNYFRSNILENKAANFGTSPWWYYFVTFTLGTVPPVSILLLVFFFLGLYKSPKNVFTWSIIPFLLIHFMLDHKEMRFLFPMAFCFIYLVIIGFDSFIDRFKPYLLWRYLFIITMITNVLLLGGIMFTSTQPAVNYYHYLYNRSQDLPIVLLCKDKSVYSMAGLEINFYKSPHVKCVVVENDEEIVHYLVKENPSSVLLLERKFSANHIYPGYTHKTVYCIFPEWMDHLNLNDWMSRSRIWKIQELTKINHP